MVASFVVKLCVGITLMWCFMPRREVTDGFFRIQMRLVLGLAVLGTLAFSAIPLPEEPEFASRAVRALMVAGSIVAYVGSVLWALGRRQPGTILVYLLAVLFAAVLVTQSVRETESHRVLHLLSDLSSSAVAGSVLTGMLLGHWYLTTPTMSIRPMWWFTAAVIVSAALRLVASVWTLSLYELPEDTTQQIWLAIRWVGGILVPFSVAGMLRPILQLRNTQSATGVLFAGLILVLMGEMTATLLEHNSGVPY